MNRKDINKLTLVVSALPLPLVRTGNGSIRPSDGDELIATCCDYNPDTQADHADAIVAACNAVPELMRIAMTTERVDQIRQRLQAIMSEADNIRTKLKKLGIEDSDITESQQAIDRGVQSLDTIIRKNTQA